MYLITLIHYFLHGHKEAKNVSTRCSLRVCSTCLLPLAHN